MKYWATWRWPKASYSVSSISCGWMPKRAAGVAVDRQRQRRALGLLVGGDVAQLRQRLHLGQHLRRPFVELVEIGVLQRVLILGARRPAADPDVLRRLQEQAGALDLLELGPQAGDDLLGGCARARCAASA